MGGWVGGVDGCWSVWIIGLREEPRRRGAGYRVPPNQIFFYLKVNCEYVYMAGLWVLSVRVNRNTKVHELKTLIYHREDIPPTYMIFFNIVRTDLGVRFIMMKDDMATLGNYEVNATSTVHFLGGCFFCSFLGFASELISCKPLRPRPAPR